MSMPICTIRSTENPSEEHAISWNPQDGLLYADGFEGPIDDGYVSENTEQAACLCAWWYSGGEWDIKWQEEMAK